MNSIKIQDIVFIVVLIVLCYVRKPKLITLAGLGCFVVAIPLYYQWIFFTAHRMVMYGAFLLFVSTLLLMFQNAKK